MQKIRLLCIASYGLLINRLVWQYTTETLNFLFILENNPYLGISDFLNKTQVLRNLKIF